MVKEFSSRTNLERLYVQCLCNISCINNTHEIVPKADEGEKKRNSKLSKSRKSEKKSERKEKTNDVNFL